MHNRVGLVLRRTVGLGFQLFGTVIDKKFIAGIAGQLGALIGVAGPFVLSQVAPAGDAGGVVCSPTVSQRAAMLQALGNATGACYNTTIGEVLQGE